MSKCNGTRAQNWLSEKVDKWYKDGWVVKFYRSNIDKEIYNLSIERWFGNIRKGFHNAAFHDDGNFSISFAGLFPDAGEDWSKPLRGYPDAFECIMETLTSQWGVKCITSQ